MGKDLAEITAAYFQSQTSKFLSVKIYKMMYFNVIPYNIITQKYCVLVFFLLGDSRRLNIICRRFGTLCSIFIGGVSRFVLFPPPMKME